MPLHPEKLVNLKKYFARISLALCLAAGITAELPQTAEAAPLAGISQLATSVNESTPDLLNKVQYYRYHRRYYRRRYYRPRYYRPIYRHAQCRGFVGWHRTPYGMVFGPYRRCW